MSFRSQLIKWLAGVGALAIAAVAAFTTVAAARPDLAVRCDYRGCSRIYCDYSGDRCFRVDDWRYGGRPYRYAGGRWHDPRYYHGHGWFDGGHRGHHKKGHYGGHDKYGDHGKYGGYGYDRGYKRGHHDKYGDGRKRGGYGHGYDRGHKHHRGCGHDYDPFEGDY